MVIPIISSFQILLQLLQSRPFLVILRRQLTAILLLLAAGQHLLAQLLHCGFVICTERPPEFHSHWGGLDPGRAIPLASDAGRRGRTGRPVSTASIGATGTKLGRKPKRSDPSSGFTEDRGRGVGSGATPKVTNGIRSGQGVSTSRGRTAEVLLKEETVGLNFRNIGQGGAEPGIWTTRLGLVKSFPRLIHDTDARNRMVLALRKNHCDGR
mmetsp:Transcript_14920/g.26354  ORF Transcript_14920/g.26354 Transcript_14920/m.26354 type:complete len:211 (-) Transcript_14920:361-993(-)